MQKTKDSKASRLLKQLPKPLYRYLGFCFISCWSSMLFNSAFILNSSMFNDVQNAPHLFSVAFSIVVAGVIAIYAHRLTPLSSKRRMATIMGLVGTCGFLFIAFSSMTIKSPALIVIGYLICSITLIWTTLCWQEIYALHGARSATFLLALTSLIGTLFFFILSILPAQAAVALGLALPLLSSLSIPKESFSFSLRKKEIAKNSVDTFTSWAKGTPWKTLLITTISSFILGAMRTSGAFQSLTFTNTLEWLGFGLSSAVATLFGCFVVSKFRKKGIRIVFYVSLPLLAFGSICIVVLPYELSIFSLALISLGATAIQIATWILLIDEVFVKKVPALGVFALLLMFQYIGVFIGQLLGALSLMSVSGLVYLSLFLTVIASLILSSTGEKFTMSEQGLIGTPVNILEIRIEALAKKAKLSPREREIAGLWAAGHNSPYIERTLHISKNTTKTHLNHIYEKTATSNREELIALLEEQ